MSPLEVNPTRWSSPATFVMAAAAAVIGLGNVWRLPVLAGEYGGGAFLLVYGLALGAMALPLLVGELMLGRGARSDLVSMIGRWAQASGLSRRWGIMGYLALLGAVMVLSYYSVIAGWSMAYFLRSAAGLLEGLDRSGLRAGFVELAGDPERGLGWHTIFMVAATACVAQGLRRGIEPTARWMLVGAVLALLGLLAMATGDGFTAAVHFLFRPDFAALGWRGVIEAFHQAFFSLSLGVGVMLAYGAYLPDGSSLVRVSLAVMLLDTMFALLAGLAIITLVLGAGMTPESGLPLVFELLPTAGAGGWTVTLFFFMLMLVTLTSAVGLLEPLVVWLMARLQTSRVVAASMTGTLVWFIGLGTLLSFNVLADVRLLDRTLFDWLSMLSSRFLLPAFGLLLCVFIGRFLPLAALRDAWADKPWFGLWHWLLRYPTRIGLIAVLLHSMGVFEFLERLWGTS